MSISNNNIYLHQYKYISTIFIGKQNVNSNLNIITVYHKIELIQGITKLSMLKVHGGHVES